MGRRGKVIIDALFMVAVLLMVASPIVLMFVNIGIGTYLLMLALFAVASAALLCIYDERL